METAPTKSDCLGPALGPINGSDLLVIQGGQGFMTQHIKFVVFAYVATDLWGGALLS